MTRPVNITVSTTTLTWADFEVVGEDDIDGGDAEAGATITLNWSSASVEINVQHTARVESDTVQTPALLRHEQGHLDLAILVARRIRRDINKGTSPGNAQAAHLPRLSNLNIRYDNSTNHGQNTQSQGTWNTALTTALAAATPPASVNGVLL
jgi:hypothetical protein